MAVKLRKVSETYKAKVYTEDGYFLGEVEDSIIVGNKIDEWRIRVLNNDFLSRGIKGLYVKHILIKAMGQIWIVSKAVYSVISKPEEEKLPETKNEQSNQVENMENKESKNVRIEEV